MIDFATCDLCDPFRDNPTALRVLPPAWHDYGGLPRFENYPEEFRTPITQSPLGDRVRHTEDLSWDDVNRLRDRWPGKLVIKGVVTTEDAEQALACGVDGMIVSNHGGRQLDAGQSTIKPLAELVRTVGDKTTLMIDSGVRSGPDVACALATGSKLVFMGRSFMYGVCAMGKTGGEHTIFMLKRQLQQVMEQIACERVEDFPNHLIRDDC
jgi:L-lactate dehydrogenase (cytochrome)